MVTRFVPSGVAALKQAADHLKFSRRSDWSFSPSVGGFEPAAQCKAPLILVQNDRVAFGIVPDLVALDRKTLKRCSHALDLDVPGGPTLAVGFMPAKLVRHAVFSLDAARTWTADTPLENSYYLFVTAIAPPAQAYRQVVRMGYDMCWTGYWLLRWRASQLPGSDAILPRCQRLAQFMIARQSRGGMLPTRFADSGAVEEVRSRTVKAETGPVVLFLWELYRQGRSPKWLEAAKRGLDFLDRDVIPLRQWYDFETFWSCSPRKVKFDQRSGQWPANNLALGQTVAAYLAA